MAAFLLVDPNDVRRAGLRNELRYQWPEHEVVGYSTFRESISACAGKTFKAAFIFWLESMPPASAAPASWSCGQVVLIISEAAHGPTAAEWCRRVLPCALNTLEHFPEGRFTVEDLHRVANHVGRSKTANPPDPPGSSEPLTDADAAGKAPPGAGADGGKAPGPTINLGVPPPFEGGGEQGSRTEPAPPPFPEEGFTFEGYRLIDRISKTGFSSVFLARREAGELLRVVKFSQARNRDQCKAVEKIMVMADITPEAKNYMLPIEHACNAPNGDWYVVVLPCLDDSNFLRHIHPLVYWPHTFQEWIDKASRDRIVKPTDRRLVLDHLIEILNALDFFHSHNLVMNDVKPSNFGFFDGHLMVIDYGGFTRLGQRPHETTKVYGPPEERAGHPAEDVYAVVKIMAEALYGVKPNQLNPFTVDELKAFYLKDEPHLYERGLWTIIKKGMERGPDFRFQTARQMIVMLEEMKQKLGGDGKQGGRGSKSK